MDLPLICVTGELSSTVVVTLRSSGLGSGRLTVRLSSAAGACIVTPCGTDSATSADDGGMHALKNSSAHSKASSGEKLARSVEAGSETPTLSITELLSLGKRSRVPISTPRGKDTIGDPSLGVPERSKHPVLLARVDPRLRPRVENADSPFDDINSMKFVRFSTHSKEAIRTSSMAGSCGDSSSATDQLWVGRVGLEISPETAGSVHESDVLRAVLGKAVPQVVAASAR
mmetsp:Transcript_140062/g.314529  ORF Transcript_140062/g.314529 Transcript_140062/m.314529 type:complete len:229 (-) Transcript_140062:330-1016(-)